MKSFLIVSLLFPATIFAQDVVEASRLEVSTCSANVPVGTVKKVDYAWSAVCKKAGPDAPKGTFQREEAHYILSKKEDGIHVAAKLRFKIDPPYTQPSRAAFMLDRARACMSDINKYWKRYGITLDLDMDSNRKKDKSEPQYELTLSDKTGRSHSRMHYFNGLDDVKASPHQNCLAMCKLGSGIFGGANCKELCEPVRQKEFCLMVLHETGHLLGLKDEYADPMCPDREFVSTESNPWSAMAAPMLGFFDHLDFLGETEGAGLGAVEFFPRHMREIVSQFGDHASCPAPTAKRAAADKDTCADPTVTQIPQIPDDLAAWDLMRKVSSF